MPKMKAKSKIIICVFTLFVNLYCIFIFQNMYDANYTPTSPMVNISPLLTDKSISTNGYALLFSQTGLAKPAIDDLLSQKNGINKILYSQSCYYAKNNCFIEKLNPFTRQENLLLNYSVNNKTFPIVPLRNGDILLTKSTYTLYWRHGHCGIVIDAANGVTLESLEPGTFSIQQNLAKWQTYSTFKLMRLKGADQKELDTIAEYASNNLNGLKYSIFASKNHKNKLDKLNCSQLIYQAFIHFGYDLDSDKGIFVTPEDISKSRLLDVVQIYGFNPNREW